MKKMQACGISSGNSEYAAAQALSDLHRNSQGTSHGNYGRKEIIKPAKFECKCFIEGNVPKEPIGVRTPNVGVDRPLHTTDVATSQLTVTAVAGKSYAFKKEILQRYYCHSTNKHDVATQTEDESPIIEAHETVGDEVHDVSNKEDSPEMKMDDKADSSDNESDMDEPFVTDHTCASKNLESGAHGMVPIRSGNAKIPKEILKNINWQSYKSATRKLLTTVFTRRVLATHSLSGRPSPAFPNKKAKNKLNEALVNDIVQTVAQRCRVAESLVRTSITSKCADECKMLYIRENENKKRKTIVNRENIPPESDSDGL